MIIVLFALWAAVPAHAQDLAGPLVYLMEWKHVDVASECKFLWNYGFQGVVVSPPTEHVMSSPKSPWFERYEVVSYSLFSRSGPAFDFITMINKCHSSGVKVYVDLVLNNMADTNRDTLQGIKGTQVTPKEYKFLDFKKEEGHFNEPCQVDYNDIKSIRECQVAGLAKLKLSHSHVRNEQMKLLNLLSLHEVDGFLLDKSKFMSPWELALRQMRADNKWRTSRRPAMFFNVEDYGKDAAHYNEYADLGPVTDYKYGIEVAKWFKSKDDFIDIIKRERLFPEWIQSEDALVFLTNVYSHTSDQRNDVLRYNEDPVNFRLASAFMLAYNHGVPLVLSTYKMSKPYNNAGPPANAQGDILSPGTECKGGWNCEHRLPEIYSMSFFNLDCKGQPVTNQTPGPAKGQFAFARGNRGFVAFNLADTKWSQTFWTNLPEGSYCEAVTGGIKLFQGSKCRPNSFLVKVDNRGSFKLDIPARSVRAIHMWQKTGLVATYDDEQRMQVTAHNGVFSWLLHSIWMSGAVEMIPSAAPPSTSDEPPPSSGASTEALARLGSSSSMRDGKVY